MNKFLETLKRRILICDGAMGTQLMEAGMQSGECSEAWNIDHPDKVFSIHKRYIDAGADIILTNTFGGNRWTLQRHHLEDKVQLFNTEGCKIARKAASSAKFVAGDIGPTGEMPEPYGMRKEQEFEEVFLEQAKALAAAGVDFLLVETQMASEELGAAVRGAKKTGMIPVCATASFSPAADAAEYRTMMGASVETIVETSLASGADIVGANCGTIDIHDMVKIVVRIRKITDKPILIEPNAGKPVVEGSKTIYPQKPEEMAKHVRALINAGANIIGGCCGTTPAHIAAIARAVKD
jgi:5-methyltetrahydrofolate--homocysteine methyltransferase